MIKLCALTISACAVLSAGCGGVASPLSVKAQEEAVAKPTPVADENIISIAAVGDIMLASPFPDDTRMAPKDGEGMFDAVTPILSAADIAFGNMEAPIIDSGISPKCKPKEEIPTPTPTPTPLPSATPKPVICYAFRMPTRYTKYLKKAGFDVMSVANNHALDFGTAGILSTRRSLDANAIKHAGGNRAKFSTAYLHVKGRRWPSSDSLTTRCPRTSTIFQPLVG